MQFAQGFLPNQLGMGCGITAEEALKLADERRLKEALVKIREQRLEALRLAVQCPNHGDVIATARRMEEFLNGGTANG